MRSTSAKAIVESVQGAVTLIPSRLGGMLEWFMRAPHPAVPREDYRYEGSPALIAQRRQSPGVMPMREEKARRNAATD